MLVLILLHLAVLWCLYAYHRFLVREAVRSSREHAVLFLRKRASDHDHSSKQSRFIDSARSANAGWAAIALEGAANSIQNHEDTQ